MLEKPGLWSPAAAEVSALPERSRAGGTGAIIHLRPPVRAEIAGEVGHYVAFVPFGSTTAELSVGQEPPRRTRLRARGVTFAGPETRIALQAADPVEFLVLSIAPERVRELAVPPADVRAWQVPPTTDHQDVGIAALAQELRRSLLSDDLRHPAYRQALADAIVVRLLCHFSGDLSEDGPGEVLPPGRLAKVLCHIDANLDGLLRVGALAEMVGLTRSHFSRAFQRATGDPPQRYILKRRVCRARDLLSAEVTPIVEVAVRAGFSSQAHLSTAFRTEVGTTPARYRAAFRRHPGE